MTDPKPCPVCACPPPPLFGETGEPSPCEVCCAEHIDYWRNRAIELKAERQQEPISTAIEKVAKQAGQCALARALAGCGVDADASALVKVAAQTQKEVREKLTACLADTGKIPPGVYADVRQLQQLPTVEEAISRSAPPTILVDSLVSELEYAVDSGFDLEEATRIVLGRWEQAIGVTFAVSYPILKNLGKANAVVVASVGFPDGTAATFDDNLVYSQATARERNEAFLADMRTASLFTDYDEPVSDLWGAENE